MNSKKPLSDVIMIGIEFNPIILQISKHFVSSIKTLSIIKFMNPNFLDFHFVEQRNYL
jgi:hypothetical protein